VTPGSEGAGILQMTVQISGGLAGSMFSSCLNTSHMSYTCCQDAKAIIHWHILDTGQEMSAWTDV